MQLVHDGTIIVSATDLVGFLADALLAGQSTGPILMSPVQWYTTAMRATGAVRPPELRTMLIAAGQVPWYCPSVGGWPYNEGWDRAATNIARFNLAAQIASTTPITSPVVGAIAAGDNTATAWALGLGADFSPESWAAITTPADGVGRILLALVSPEFVNA